MSRYRPPTSVPSLPKLGGLPPSEVDALVARYNAESTAFLLEQLRRIAEDLSTIPMDDVPTLIVQERVDVPAGSTRRISPPTTGAVAILEAPGPHNSAKKSTIIIENPAGSLKVVASHHRAADGKITASTINNASQATYTLPGVITFTSNGVDSWKTQVEAPAETAQTARQTSLSASLDAAYHVQAAHSSLPKARVTRASSEIDLSYSASGFVSWFLKTASVGLSKLADLPGLSVLGRAANSTGVMAAITAGTQGHHLMRVTDALAFGDPAGDGLTLATTGVLNVGAGSRITVNANDVAWTGFDLNVNGSVGSTEWIGIDVIDSGNITWNLSVPGGGMLGLQPVYTGTTDEILLTSITGNQGTIDISTLDCGGTVRVASASSAYSIEGFTAREVGFWFNFITQFEASDFCTLFHEDATATAANRLQLPSQEDITGTPIAGTFVYCGESRWRFLGPNPRLVGTRVNGLEILPSGSPVVQLRGGDILIEATASSSVDIVAGNEVGIETDHVRIFSAAGPGFLSIKEASSSTESVGTGQGMHWVKDDAPNVPMFTDDGNTDHQLAYGAMALMREPQILTSGTSISHPTGTRFIRVRGVGGGGGGGGTNAAAGSVGSCGGSGTYGEKFYTLASLSSSYTIGAGGTSGSGAGGGNGGSSTFTHNSVTITLPGGVGGSVRNGAAADGHAGGGTGGGAATNADFEIAGQNGGGAIYSAGDGGGISMHSGPGGGTPLGNGGAGIVTSSTGLAGRAASGYGSGGGGALNNASASANSGQDGAPGVWIVEEYG